MITAVRLTFEVVKDSVMVPSSMVWLERAKMVMMRYDRRLERPVIKVSLGEKRMVASATHKK